MSSWILVTAYLSSRGAIPRKSNVAISAEADVIAMQRLPRPDCIGTRNDII
ncbi:MAG: hypothetical protein WCA51_03485 [Dehalococcoidia bacterium]